MDIEFYYDFISPNVYFVHKVLPDIAAKHGARILYRPMLLGGVFKATNNNPPLVAFAGTPQKIDYMRLEIDRFMRRYSVAFKFSPHFPVNTVAIMRAAVFARGKEWEQKFIDTVMDAVWVHEQNMGDLEVVAHVLDAASLPTAEILEAIQTPEIKGALADVTADAVAHKIFGAPTMFLGQEMFFGKDSLDDLDWMLDQS